MNSRTLIGFAVALVVLVGLAAFGHRSAESSDTGTGALFMPGLKPQLNDVDRVKVVGAGEKPIATLVRKKDGWVVAEKDQYPADVSKVRDALLNLAEAHIVEQKTANPDYYSRLGVEPVKLSTATGTELTLLEGDKTIAAVTIGKSSGKDYRYARNDAQPASYLVDKALEVPTEAAKWTDPKIVDIPGKSVREVTITRANGETLTIAKAKAEQQDFAVENVPKGRELQYPGVADVVGNALHDLQLQDVAAASADEPLPAVTSVYRTFDGLVVTVKGTKKDDAAWVELAASVDTDQVAAGDGSASSAKDSSASSAKDTHGADTDAAASKTAPAKLDPHAQADAINARVHGWRYRIASYQYDQMTRRMDDLLKAEQPPQAKQPAEGKKKK
ncbi:MAG TPA: DUF4340 domain-containing protein [Gammaproteobacteria bacterium]|nr:DUF4340 domain-containing protein [Gammaproteobacteria bacterium]